MNKLFYPALFHIAEEGSFKVLFPDIPECLAQGNDLTQAYETAVEALGLAAAIYDRQRRLGLLCGHPLYAGRPAGG